MARGVVVACPSCGRPNRIPYARIGAVARCGACHRELPAPTSPVEVDEAALDELIANSTVPVLVDFWAPWCGPCRAVAPELMKVAERNAGKLVVAKLDTEKNPAAAQRHAVRSIPTMAVFVGGRERARSSGARPASAIEAFAFDAAR